MQSSRGFTLIELLVVLVIVSILAAVAIPQYSTYTKRAKFAEVIAATTPYKLGVEECYIKTGGPLTNCDAGSNGIPAARATAEGVVASINVTDGVITATGIDTIGSYTYILTPSATTTSITWVASGTCASGGVC